MKRRAFLTLLSGALCAPSASFSESSRLMPSQTAHRFYKDCRTALPPSAHAATIAWTPQLIFPPGFCAYNSPVYDMTAPGLYRFTHYPTPSENWGNTTNMIVYAGDPIALLSAAAWLSSFGDADNALSAAQLSIQARTSKLHLLCGPLHAWAKSQLLDPQGVTSRTVQFLTMDTPNNYVDGHVTLEVAIGGKPALVDISNNVMFKDAAGNLLSARGAVGVIAGDSFEYEALADDGYAVESSGGFDATAYVESELLTEADRRAWHRRIFQAIGMTNGSEVWWKLPAGSEYRQSWVESLQSNFRVKPSAVWDAAFYPA